MNATRESLIADWNRAYAPVAPSAKISVHDETLRDGLQSVSVLQPSLDDKLELLNLMAGVGVDTACLGMPVTSATARAHVLRLVAEIAASRLDVGATCAARTTCADIGVVADIAQETGMAVSVMAFIGISRIRMLSEGWSVESVTAAARDAVAFARREGIGICIVTEDTTRTSLDVTIDVYAAALDAGADRICVCDTVGYATPWSAAALVSQLRLGLARRGFPEVGIDWHGHNDRGLALANALAAASAGAGRLHGTALGMGERAGNTAIEQLLPNLRDLGWRDGDLALLPRYCEQASRSCGVSIPGNQPFAGQDVFSSMAGVHVSAIKKAEQIGGDWLAEHVYAGIPAAAVGRAQSIEIGPASGRANILAWLGVRGILPVPALVDQIRRAAADAGRVLSDQQLMAIVSAARWQEVLPRIGTGKTLQDRYASRQRWVDRSSSDVRSEPEKLSPMVLLSRESTAMSEAARAVPSPRWRGRVLRLLAGAGRKCAVGLYMAGVSSGGVMFDVSMMKTIDGWAARGSGDRQLAADDDLVPVPPGSIERLIPEVPLSPDERELWADLLAVDASPRAGRGWLRFR